MVGASPGDGGAPHVARLAVVVAAHAVHHLPVVPHDEVPRPPRVHVDEPRLGRVLVQVAQQDARLRHRHADDAAGVGRQVERLAAGHRMRAHQPLAHRPEHRPLLVRVVEHAERAARVHQRVLADQVLDQRLRGRVERVVGRAHVGELGVAAHRIHHPGRQQRVLGRDRPERAVGVPEHVAEVEERARGSRARAAGRPCRGWRRRSCPICRRLSSGLVMLPPRASSSAPKLRLNAICCSSVIFWSWKTSTA